MSSGPSTQLRTMSCNAVGNCDEHGGAESRPEYETAKQSSSRAIIINTLLPQAMLRHRAQAVAWQCSLVQSTL